MNPTRTLHTVASCAALLFWAALLVYFCASDRITAFLHPMFRPWSMAAGILLGILAVLYAVAVRKSPDSCCDGEDCAETGSRGVMPRVAALLLLVGAPLGAAVLSADGFSTHTVYNRGIVTDASGLSAGRERPEGDLPGGVGGEAEPFALPKDAEGRLQAEVIDLVYGTQDEGIRKDFEGKPVVVVGQLLPATEMNPDGDRMKLVRMFMICCAADARPIAVLFRKPDAFQAPEMSWVRVSGRATFPTVGGSRIVLIDPAEVEPCDPPEETMLF
jgi:uncharacterized repeat protein (TIGR03943 family)